MNPAITLPQDDLLKWPRFTEAEEAAVLRVLRDGSVSSHPVVRELEDDFRSLTGRRHALAHGNGTSALLAAFHALDLPPGSEVLVPAATFWASVLPMIWCGLVPVFCESEPDTLGLDPEDAACRITPRTRAMVIVHLWGLPCRVKALQQLADAHGLKIIEDASHAHGASLDGIPCGRFGDVSVFSMQGDKLVPAGEGGVLLTDDEALLRRAVCLGDIRRILELPMPDKRFAATGFGMKTRIAPMSAALGRAMLARLAETNAIRGANHRQLSAVLEELGLETFLPPTGTERVWFEFLIRPRDPAVDVPGLVERLVAEGARVSSPRYPLLHRQPFFTEGHWRTTGRYPAPADLPEIETLSLPKTDELNGRLIRLPNFTHPESAPLLDQYAEAFRRAIGSR